MGTFTEFIRYLCRITEKTTQMNYRLSEKCSPDTSEHLFPMGEERGHKGRFPQWECKDKYWDTDSLCYRRTTAVPAAEQKRLPEQIAAIIERAEKTSWTRRSRWMRQVIEDVLYPARAFERDH